MLVNLFDNTFRQSVCSTAGRTPEHVQYARDQMHFDGVTLFTDGFIVQHEQVDCPVKIAWLHEPPCLIPQVYADAIDHAREFDAVLTYHPDLLALGAPYHFMPYAGAWIPDSEWGMRPKTHLVSMLVGAKRATEGHRLRHVVAEVMEYLGVDLYGVRGMPVDYGWQTKLRVLGDYAFSVVGEACRIDNLFTEILLDCFAVGTIPIFWGCSNAGNYFDARGVLSFETPAECKDVVSRLSMELYEKLRPYAVENLKRVAPYACAEDWMYEHILQAYDD